MTTVAGATSITVHCQFTGPDAKPILARDVHGKVRFFGGNLKATYDFAINTVEAPCPHPISATRAPAFNFASTPSSAGIQLETRFAK